MEEAANDTQEPVEDTSYRVLVCYDCEFSMYSISGSLCMVARAMAGSRCRFLLQHDGHHRGLFQ